MDAPFIKCPKCDKEYETLTGMFSTDMDDLNGMFDSIDNLDIEKAEKDLINHDTFFPCYACGHVFPYENTELWYYVKKDALRCPTCDVLVSKTPENKSSIGYACPVCRECLEYTRWPTHGTGNIKLVPTTDYFHGKCPKCAPDAKHYHMMVLGNEIKTFRYILKIPLVCVHCGYRDLIKIGLKDHSAIPNVIFE